MITSTPVVRRIRQDELPAFVEALGAGFLERPDPAVVAEKLGDIWDYPRTWLAEDAGTICGTFLSWATELTVPGGARLPAAAIASVTVRATHRRRGILRRLVAAEHRAIRERGEAVGLLYASEYPIYGRFGYGPAVRVATWTLDTHSTRFTGLPVRGIEPVTRLGEALAAIRAVHERVRTSRAGEIRRRDRRWEIDLGLRENGWDPPWRGFLVLHRDEAGGVDGYARYRADDRWKQRQPRVTLTVDDLQAASDEAYDALWRFLAETDLVATVKAGQRSPGERLPWLLTNARAAVPSEIGDGLWVRLADVPRALETRTYDVREELVLEIVEEAATSGEGGESDAADDGAGREEPGPTDEPRSLRHRVLLDAGPDGATCTRTSRSPDLTFHLGALGAAYLGGTHLSDAVRARGVDEHRTGALATADRLFRTLEEPVCSTFF